MSVDAEGNITLVDNHEAGTGSNRQFTSVCGDGRFIFVAGSHGLSSFTVSDTGTLTHKDSVSIGGGTAQGLSADGEFIYVAAGNNGFRVYSVTADGELTLVELVVD